MPLPLVRLVLYQGRAIVAVTDLATDIFGGVHGIAIGQSRGGGNAVVPLFRGALLSYTKEPGVGVALTPVFVAYAGANERS
jgi:hypothetical protein